MVYRPCTVSVSWRVPSSHGRLSESDNVTTSNEMLFFLHRYESWYQKGRKMLVAFICKFFFQQIACF